MTAPPAAAEIIKGALQGTLQITQQNLQITQQNLASVQQNLPGIDKVAFAQQMEAMNNRLNDLEARMKAL